MNDIALEFEKIKEDFETKSGLHGVPFSIVDRPTKPVLKLYVAQPTERLFRILDEVRGEHRDDYGDLPLATLARRAGGNLLERPEGQLFIRTLAESQNVNRFSFRHDFMLRYTKSVFGAESQITASANHVVLGRRGAGKSMLLLYAMHFRERERKPTVWIDMQVYSGRGDIKVIADILSEILSATRDLLEETDIHRELISKLLADTVNLEQIRQLLPTIRRILSAFAVRDQELFICLDDFHVIKRSMQPQLLDVIYAISRGNRIFVKMSAIETLVRTYDPTEKLGMNIPQDAQFIRLDYNLTTPDKTTKHIEAILNGHAQFSGLPSIRRLCTSNDVIFRLTWVSAGVPRDALSLFGLAIAKASQEGRGIVSVSNVNVAASDTMTTKLRELETDASESADALKGLLNRVEAFCIAQKRTNAFLVEMRSDLELYDAIRNLVDLRFLHVISEGISIGKAGRRYLGLILDYGFYVGVRAARSVELFNRQSEKVSRKDLRRLPVFAG